MRRMQRLGEITPDEVKLIISSLCMMTGPLYEDARRLIRKLQEIEDV